MEKQISVNIDDLKQQYNSLVEANKIILQQDANQNQIQQSNNSIINLNQQAMEEKKIEELELQYKQSLLSQEQIREFFTHQKIDYQIISDNGTYLLSAQEAISLFKLHKGFNVYLKDGTVKTYGANGSAMRFGVTKQNISDSMVSQQDITNIHNAITDFIQYNRNYIFNREGLKNRKSKKISGGTVGEIAIALQNTWNKINNDADKADLIQQFLLNDLHNLPYLAGPDVQLGNIVNNENIEITRLVQSKNISKAEQTINLKTIINNNNQIIESLKDFINSGKIDASDILKLFTTNREINDKILNAANKQAIENIQMVIERLK